MSPGAQHVGGLFQGPLGVFRKGLAQIRINRVILRRHLTKSDFILNLARKDMASTMPPSLESVMWTQFRVVKFELCHDSECTFSTNLHLIVTTDYVELKRGKAIALSYTWGELDRRRRCIGHRPDSN